MTNSKTLTFYSVYRFFSKKKTCTKKQHPISSEVLPNASEDLFFNQISVCVFCTLFFPHLFGARKFKMFYLQYFKLKCGVGFAVLALTKNSIV